jgi:uncharacterized OsmC-like protein
MTALHIQQSIEQFTTFLAQNPAKARVADKAAVATIQYGLCVKAEGPNGATLVSDMPAGVGGGGTAPTPGWFLRAALANCDATVIAMRAAQVGIVLTRLQVSVDSVSDNRGMLGLGENIPPGPESIRIRVAIAADGVSRDQLQEIVHWAEAHSPVGDALRRAIRCSMEIDTA